MAEIAWDDESDIFHVQVGANVGAYRLEVFDVIGGSNTDSQPYHYEVRHGGETVASGPAASLRDGMTAAEQALDNLEE